jgi:hypothetical protein
MDGAHELAEFPRLPLRPHAAEAHGNPAPALRGSQQRASRACRLPAVNQAPGPTWIVMGDGHTATAEHVSSLARLLLAVDEAENGATRPRRRVTPIKRERRGPPDHGVAC